MFADEIARHRVVHNNITPYFWEEYLMSRVNHLNLTHCFQSLLRSLWGRVSANRFKATSKRPAARTLCWFDGAQGFETQAKTVLQNVVIPQIRTFRKNRGIQWDARIVDAFFDRIDDIRALRDCQEAQDVAVDEVSASEPQLCLEAAK
jgi:hypothetical protein